MKNINITRKISQGMYVLTTKNGGCIVDAVSQISSGENPLISVSVMKKNYTNELLKNNNKFAISILGKDVNPDIIKTFGFNSGREINKFENTEVNQVEGINVRSVLDDQKVSGPYSSFIVQISPLCYSIFFMVIALVLR